MSWEQCKEWMAAFQLMPWGDEYQRDAVIMSLLYNANRGKSAKAMEPIDYMPVKKRNPSPVAMEAEFLAHLGGMR